jgi:hypothetical protein
MAIQFDVNKRRETSLEAGVQNEKPDPNASAVGTESPPPFLLDKESLDRLGRERPDVFPNRWIELGFCFCLLSSELLAVSLVET